ncbi:MAG: ubiquinol-cytochrome c reductase iron-sulfur subunit [Chloroflexota bacterium]|nr:ubiquinol-cytochrome c reductase iron-sulfur subunit [Chloroflexota bacterium]
MRRDNASRDGSVSRRTFLGYAAGAISAFMAAAMGFITLGGTLSPALRKKESGQWARVGRADGFPTDRPRKVDLEVSVKDGWMETKQAKSVWVVKGQSGEFTVYNARCTHLGCIVDWKTEKREPFSAHHWKGPAFYSPCHAGVFDINGVVLGGPPPRPLDTLESRVDRGELWCKYQDFVVGVPGKSPV